MTNYLFLSYPLFIVILLFVNRLSDGKYDKIYTYLLTAVLSVVCGFRNFDSGYDTESYIYLFENLNSYEDILNGYMSWKGDYFFTFLTFLSKMLSPNPRFFLVVVSFVSLLLITKGLKKLFESNKDKFLLICLFYCTPMVFLLFGNVIRQGLAVSLFIFGLSYYNTNRKIFYLFLLLAFLSHKSAIIFFLFPLYESLKLNYKYIKIFIIAIIIKTALFSIIIFIPFLKNKLFFYQENFIETENIIQIIVLTMVILIILNKRIFSKKIENDLIYNYFFFIVTISLMFFEFPKISGRLFLWISPILPYILIYSFRHYKHYKPFKYLTTTMLILLSFAAMMSNQIQNNLQY